MGKKRKLGTAPILGIIPTESIATRKAEESSKTESLSFSIRCSEKLYAVKETYDCAMNLGCVPCAYKIGCFDVALDKEFCKARPNQRPEQCPRSSSSSNQQNRNNGVMGFRRGMSILTVGDGDFSFSLGLARALLGQQDSQNSNNNDETVLVATSYESEATLRKVYPDFERTLCELQKLGVHVAYNVDATRILETLPTAIKSPRFHRICWNFPCTAIGGGQDGQNKAMEDNKELVRNFVESSKNVLRTGGELYVCHKTKPPYNQWDLETVALEKQQRTTTSNNNSNNGAAITRLYYSGRIVLDRFLLPPYTPRKALDKKSFPCHDACFYVFAQEATAKTKKKKAIVFESTIPRDDQEEICGSIDSPATTLVKIEPKLLCRLRQKFMSSAAASSSAKKSRKSKKQKTNHKRRTNFAPPQRF